MKNIVISDEFKTGDIKPDAQEQQYRQLVQDEFDTFFPKQSLIPAVCPACAEKASSSQFILTKLNYNVCASCGSWYAAQKPTDEAIIAFYKTSKARRFWNEAIYARTLDSRRNKIIKPRFQWIEDSTAEYLPKAGSYADINANQSAYIESISQLVQFTQKDLINPLVATGNLKAGVNVIDKAWWHVSGQWDVISLFETIDHTADVPALMNKVQSLLKTGGLCFLTGILASGFDLRVLGAHATHVMPPDRLNALTVDGIQVLAKRFGFECLEISTPGILDLQIVAKAQALDPTLSLGGFETYLLNRPQETQIAFQEFLQANRLSSYGRAVLRKI